MVQIHTGDDRTVGIKHVDGIQPSAQSDFQHHHIDFFADENIDCRQCVELEISQGNTGARRFDALERRHYRRVFDRTGIDGDALVVTQQVRAGQRTDLEAGLGVDLRQISADRTLAVCACYDHNRT